MKNLRPVFTVYLVVGPPADGAPVLLAVRVRESPGGGLTRVKASSPEEAAAGRIMQDRIPLFGSRLRVDPAWASRTPEEAWDRYVDGLQRRVDAARAGLVRMRRSLLDACNARKAWKDAQAAPPTPPVECAPGGPR